MTRPQDAGASQRRQAGRDEVPRGRLAEEQPLGLAVVGDERDPAARGPHRVADRDRPSAQRDGSRGRGVQAGQGAQDVGRAAAELPGQRVDAAGPGGEGEAVEPSRHAQVLDPQGVRRVGGLLARGGRPVARLAEHPGDQLVHGQPGGGAGGDVVTVTQYGHDVAQIEDLGQPVGDEDDRAARGRDPPDRGEHVPALGIAEGRGGLVEDHQPGVLAERLGDLDQLPFADAERRQRLVRGDALQAHIVQDPPAPGRGRAPPVDERRAEVAEQHVVEHGQGRYDAQLLVHERHARALGGPAAAQLHRLAADHDAPAVGRELPGQHLHHRALARAVVAAQAVDLAGAHGEGDVPHRGDAVERVRQPLHAEQRTAPLLPAPLRPAPLRPAHAWLHCSANSPTFAAVTRSSWTVSLRGGFLPVRYRTT